MRALQLTYHLMIYFMIRPNWTTFMQFVAVISW